jgi:hypothetical protein
MSNIRMAFWVMTRKHVKGQPNRLIYVFVLVFCAVTFSQHMFSSVSAEECWDCSRCMKYARSSSFKVWNYVFSVHSTLCDQCAWTSAVKQLQNKSTEMPLGHLTYKHIPIHMVSCMSDYVRGLGWLPCLLNTYTTRYYTSQIIITHRLVFSVGYSLH